MVQSPWWVRRTPRGLSLIFFKAHPNKKRKDNEGEGASACVSDGVGENI